MAHRYHGTTPNPTPDGRPQDRAGTPPTRPVPGRPKTASGRGACRSAARARPVHAAGIHVRGQPGARRIAGPMGLPAQRPEQMLEAVPVRRADRGPGRRRRLRRSRRAGFRAARRDRGAASQPTAGSRPSGCGHPSRPRMNHSAGATARRDRVVRNRLRGTCAQAVPDGFGGRTRQPRPPLRVRRGPGSRSGPVLGRRVRGVPAAREAPGCPCRVPGIGGGARLAVPPRPGRAVSLVGLPWARTCTKATRITKIGVPRLPGHGFGYTRGAGRHLSDIILEE